MAVVVVTSTTPVNAMLDTFVRAARPAAPDRRRPRAGRADHRAGHPGAARHRRAGAGDPRRRAGPRPREAPAGLPHAVRGPGRGPGARDRRRAARARGRRRLSVRAVRRRRPDGARRASSARRRAGRRPRGRRGCRPRARTRRRPRARARRRRRCAPSGARRRATTCRRSGSGRPDGRERLPADRADAVGAREPVDGVVEHRGHGAVVLRRHGEHPVGASRRPSRRRRAATGTCVAVDLLVVERAAGRGPRRPRARRPRAPGRGAGLDDAAVEGVGTQAAEQDDDAGLGHRVSSRVVGESST